MTAHCAHGKFKRNKRCSIRKWRTDESWRQTTGKALHSLGPPGLPEAVDHARVLALCWVQGVCLDLGLDHVDGVDTAPESVACCGTVGEGGEWGQVFTLAVVDLSVALDEVLVCEEVESEKSMVTRRVAHP